MASDYKVIFSGRQHFGNEPGTFNNFEPGLVFKGPQGTFTFDCPNIDSNEMAVLMFRSLNVDKSQTNVFSVNDVDVFGPRTTNDGHMTGGLPGAPDRFEWNGNIQLLENRHKLTATGNRLHIEARNESGSGGGNIDDFVLDNMVIMYKTRPRTISPGTNQQV